MDKKMVSRESFDNMCCRIAKMNREECKHRIIHFHGRIKLDFTESYLDTLPEDRLRHILMAAVMVDAEKQTRPRSGYRA